MPPVGETNCTAREIKDHSSQEELVTVRCLPSATQSSVQLSVQLPEAFSEDSARPRHHRL